MVLSKSQPVELLFPMFIQNLTSDHGQSDKGNEDFYKEVIDKIDKQHDREISLLSSDHEDFMTFLNKSGKNRKLKFPVKDPPAFSRRSLNSKAMQQKDHSIKWLCFVKSISTSKTIVTLLPKSYSELKNLLLDEGNLAGNNPVAVQIVQKPIIPLIPKHQPYLPQSVTPDESLISNDNSNNSSQNNLDHDSGELRNKSGSISR